MSGCWITACLTYLFVIGLASLVIWRLPLRRVLHSLTHLKFHAPEPFGWHGAEVPTYTALPEARAEKPAPKTELLPSVDARDNMMLFHSWSEVPQDDWNSIVPEHQLFLQPAYLQAMEKAPTTHTQPRYGMLYREGLPAGIATFQLIETPLDELGDSVDTNRVEKALRWTGSLHQTEDGRPAVRILLCGNALVSDSCSMAHTNALTTQEMLSALQHMTQTLQKQESKISPLTFVAIKDLTPEQTDEAGSLVQAGYHSLHIDPTMTLHMRENWHTVDDYLADMSSKYRQRYRATRKKGKELVTKSMEAVEIERNTVRLQELLHNVCENAPFRLTEVEIPSFVELKRSMGDSFQFKGYYLEDKLVGFSAAFLKASTNQEDRIIENNEERAPLEAYLVGIDYDYNHSHKIYLNMLYDFVEEGIANGVPCVLLGRTAWEIKSTIGAEATYRITHIRHPNWLVNKLVSPLLNLVPPTKWKPRSPFKN